MQKTEGHKRSCLPLIGMGTEIILQTAIAKATLQHWQLDERKHKADINFAVNAAFDIFSFSFGDLTPSLFQK